MGEISQAGATQIDAGRMADAEAGIRQRFKALSPLLDEQLLRRFVAAEAIAAGYGGVSLVSRITNIARSTINRGIDEINASRRADQVGWCTMFCQGRRVYGAASAGPPGSCY